MGVNSNRFRTNAITKECKMAAGEGERKAGREERKPGRREGRGDEWRAVGR